MILKKTLICESDLADSKISILVNFITYSILLEFYWFLMRWNALEKRYNYDSFHVCDAWWVMMNESAEVLMFEFWKVDFSIESETLNKNCSEYFIIERIYHLSYRLSICQIYLSDMLVTIFTFSLRCEC